MSNSTSTTKRPELLRFERFELTPYSGELKREGVSILLGRRTLRLLLTLLDADGKPLTNEELLHKVWPGLVVEQNTLQVHISLLRKALGESRYMLKTLKGSGYALESTAPVLFQAESEDASVVVDNSFPRSPFIGRVRELADLTVLTESSALVSLVGPGGVGKTRLALELGRRMALNSEWELCVVDLAPLRNPSQIPNVVAAALDVGATPNLDVTDAIVAALAEQARLVIFDNCEYIALALARFVTELLDRTPRLLIVATSQRSLGAVAEQVYRVEPLSLTVDPLSSAKVSDAVSFFIDRAVSLDAAFSTNAERLALVAKICEHLDGVPLAIEMAVSRLRLLGLEELYASLDTRLQLQNPNSLDSDGRYPSIRAMLDWNHGLLEGKEQEIFRKLAIFPSSFSLEAALSVASFKDDDRWSLIDGLGDLVDKSLVTVDESEPPRYRLLETVRLYGLEKLEGAGELGTAAERHARYYCDLFDRASGESQVTLPETGKGIYRFDFDNIRATMQWAFADAERADIAISLAGSACHAWREFSFQEGRQYVDRALRLISNSTPLPIVARLYKQAGNMWYTSDENHGLELWEAAATAFRSIPDTSNLAQILSVIGHVYCWQNRDGEAKKVLYEALSLVRQTGGKRLTELLVLSGLGVLHCNLKEPSEARRLYIEAKEIAHEIGDVAQEQAMLSNLAELEYKFGSIDDAIAIARSIIANLREMPRGSFKQFLREVTTNLTSYLLIKGLAEDAAIPLQEAMQLAREEGGSGVTSSVELTAYFALAHHEPSRAAEMLGFADDRYLKAGTVRDPSYQEVRDSVKRQILAEIDEPTFAKHAKIGEQWTEEYALSVAAQYFPYPT
jgi:predicted ATPase/DNA-binding winged helix-turn-helix (wHTH) protein